MGVKVTNRAYRNQFYPVAQETDWLIGNVGDWQQLRVEFDVTIDFLASSSETVTLDDINKTIKLNNGKSWQSYGFDIGDSLKFDWSFADDYNNNGTFRLVDETRTYTIVNVFGDTIQLAASDDLDISIEPLKPPFQIIPTDRGNVKIYNVRFSTVKEPEGLKFRYSHITNEAFSSDNLNSFIDGSVTEFSFAGLNNLTTGIPATMNPDGIQSGMAIDNCQVIKNAPVNGVYKYTVTCDFMIASFFEDPSNLEDRVAPSTVFNAGSLTDNFELILYPEWNNPNTVIKNNLDHTERLGNTGWFDENFNGLDNNFTLDKVSYTDADGNTLQQLDYANPVNIEIDISGIKNLSSNSEFNIGFAWIPQDEADYQNKETPFHQNLFMNTGKVSSQGLNVNGSFNSNENTGTTVFPGYSSGDPKMDLKATDDIMFKPTGTDKTTVKATFIPNAFFTEFFENKSENDRNYIIWVSVADHNLAINFSDRVSVLVDYSNMLKVIPPAGEYQGMTNQFIEHPQNESVVGVDKYFGFVEDDILSRISFKLSKDVGISLRGMIFGYEVVNEVTGAAFALEEYPVNLSIFPKDTNGVQQINFDDTRGFKLEIGNNKNWVKIQRDENNDIDSEAAYKVYFGTKIRWENWLQRDNVPIEFYNNTLENDGYNNDWLDYLRATGDYKINFFVLTDAIEDDEFKVYKNTFEITFNDYDENLNITTDHKYYRDATNTLLNVGTDPVTGKPLGVLLNNEFTRIEITYTHLTENFDFPKMYAVTSLEIDKGAGEFEYRQLSSVWGRESGNPLTPVSGETKLKFELLTANSVKATCLVDSSLLENAALYKITGRIGCWAEGSNTIVNGKYEDKYEDKYE